MKSFKTNEGTTVYFANSRIVIERYLGSFYVLLGGKTYEIEDKEAERLIRDIT